MTAVQYIVRDAVTSKFISHWSYIIQSSKHGALHLRAPDSFM